MTIRDHYGDGAFYDAEYVHIRADIPYYTQIAKETRGPILELACGTGRLSFPMAKAGAEVCGIDNAPPMIARAREKQALLDPEVRARVQFDVADMRRFRAGRKFQAVVLGFNTLMHMLKDEDLLAALETAREHLAPGGLFHLDLHTPFPEKKDFDPDSRFDPQEMILPATGQRFVVTENNRYDPRTQINQMQFFYQEVDRAGATIGPEISAALKLRVIFPRELDRFLKDAGLEIVSDFEDFAKKTPFTGGGGRRILTTASRTASPRS